MAESQLPFDTNTALAQLEAAAAEGKLLPAAVENIRIWLTNPCYDAYLPELVRHLADRMWEELNEAFRATIPFGTGGRRGRMYPIGTNTINDRTIGESAQGLADYVCRTVDKKPLVCAIAYDTRHRSRHFAELCGGIMAKAGFTVCFLDDCRSTPELSFTVRYKDCACGIMVTASHNPPSDNAVKVYWSTGGQLVPPHDNRVIEQVKGVREIDAMSFEEGLASKRIICCREEIDAAFFQSVEAQSRPGPRELKIIYSPLHGVGTSAVCPVLEATGFDDVEVFGPHAEPNGDFPNVPDHVSNPENPAVFHPIIERAKQSGADLIMATDPDCDRLGCAAPKSIGPGSPWDTLTGNQIGALLTDYLLDAHRQAGTLAPDLYVVKTLVTTELIRRVADHYGVRTAGNLLVGFKWIGDEIDRRGPENFVFGAEESYGFLAGSHVRDKDGAVAAMLLAELAARLKSKGLSLHEQLDALFGQHGCHSELTRSVVMPGDEGMKRMQAVMARFRQRPPTTLRGLPVAQTRDYLHGTVTKIGGKPRPLDGPEGDMVILDLAAEGNYAAVRPSGTEPKVKFYTFAYDPPGQSTDLDATKTAQAERLTAVQNDLKAFAGV